MQRHAARSPQRAIPSPRGNADPLARPRLVASGGAAAPSAPEESPQPEWASWSDWRCAGRERWVAEAHGTGPRGGFSIHLRLDTIGATDAPCLAVEEVVFGVDAGEPVRAVGGLVDFGDRGATHLDAPRLVLPLGPWEIHHPAAAVLGFRIAPRPHGGTGSCRISGRRTLAWCDELEQEPIDVECTSSWDCGRPERVAWLVRSRAGLVRGVLRRAIAGRS